MTLYRYAKKLNNLLPYLFLSSKMSIEKNIVNKPNNHYKIWNNDEEQLLLRNIQNNLSIDEIAKLHERTKGAIKARLKKIAINLYNKNESIDKIQIITGLSKSDILDTIKRNDEKSNNIMKIQNLIEDLKKMENHMKQIEFTMNEKFDHIQKQLDDLIRQ